MIDSWRLADLIEPGEVEEAASRAKGANALHQLAHMGQAQHLMVVQGICNSPCEECGHYGAQPGEDGQQGRLLDVYAVVLVVVGWNPQEHQEVQHTCRIQPNGYVKL